MPQASYRRERDYTNDFNWMYELKVDVYKCYVKTRNDKSTGYMKRLKIYGMKCIENIIS